ncbi:Alpha/beta hydrolase family protein [Desulfuromusa kysingii]|uniref:Alpha/beta hydrolase family protein n=1 Tax=Desulfuromusa kysingii TaxID=37625 RepID=A0A1H3W1T5_9BACT|nr:YqiA/YcfP family alpha/beta fold hydrolase [Desulfuromusa kysingii]SDZ80861.1 Alpha/beta hydrolase family protein [Desulfuromusa kysingii]
MKIMFLHGLESGPHGHKYQALKAMFGDILAPDCRGIKDETERLKIITEVINHETGPFLVVGSSMGGLMALRLQNAHPDQVAGLVLCAPAIHRPTSADLNLDNLPPTIVIHGIEDDVVPIEASHPFGERLRTVNDDHRLSNSIEEILCAVAEIRRTVNEQK